MFRDIGDVGGSEPFSVMVRLRAFLPQVDHYCQIDQTLVSAGKSPRNISSYYARPVVAAQGQIMSSSGSSVSYFVNNMLLALSTGLASPNASAAPAMARGRAVSADGTRDIRHRYGGLWPRGVAQPRRVILLVPFKLITCRPSCSSSLSIAGLVRL